MIRRTTQRPTGKTAVPRHPFFIGSRPEPVFRGGIFSSLFGHPPNCDPGVLTSENILNESVGKSKFGDFLILQGLWKSQGLGGKVGTLCLAAEEYCSKWWPNRAPRPPRSYGVSASLKQRRPGEPSGSGRRKPGAAACWAAGVSPRARGAELAVRLRLSRGGDPAALCTGEKK